MSKPQDHDAADDDSAAESEDDLNILKEMNIDHDFNVWSDLRSLRVSVSSNLGTTPVVPGVKNDSDESNGKDNIQGIDSSAHFGLTSSAYSDTLSVSFSRLTPEEKRGIRAWNIRLSKETVFSRYYFPEQWELRELKTIEKFLQLEDPHESPLFLNAPGQEATKKAITSTFFPGDMEAKSVLLKRGPILSDGAEERELLLFTHSFLLSRIEFDTLLNIMVTINSENPQYLNSKQLRERFNAIDSDQSGSLDRFEVKEIFDGMGMPISEHTLSDIMEKFDTDNDGTIDCAEFESEMLSKLQPKKESRWSWESLGEKLKNTIRGSDAEQKLDCAYLLSDIEKIESTNICYSESTQMFAKSSWAELVFAIFIKGGGDPLVMVCSKPEHRLAWVDAFRTCYVKSTQLRANSGFNAAKKIRGQVGWQHRIIRASLFSLVVCNDLTLLEEQLANPSPDIDIDDQDEYYGYTALHYAVVLCHMDCAKLLLRYGAKVNLNDNDQKTPLDHAVLSENKDMIQLLEHHGGEEHSSEVLFKSAIEEQNELKSGQSQSPKTSGKKMMAKAKKATGAMSDAMSALRERGEKIENLDNKTAQLHSEASNYAEMAKQMKEKNKKKATFFGV